MPSFSKLLIHLERFDTYPAADALNHALAQCMTDPNANPAAQQAGQALWEQWRSTEAGQAAWSGLVTWADQRLTHWHSLKMQAVESAWKSDPSGQDAQGILRAVLTDVRQGLVDHPQLVADAHFLQALAHAQHPFSFTQALRELRGEGLNLPPDDQSLVRHCAICATAFKFLIPAPAGAPAA